MKAPKPCDTRKKTHRQRLNAEKVVAIRRAEGTLAKIAKEHDVTIGIAHGIRSGKYYQTLN